MTAFIKQTEQWIEEIQAYLAPTAGPYEWKDHILTFPIQQSSPAIVANDYYFGHPEWSKNYLDAVHRDIHFQERWYAAIGSWADKVVVDIGCGPGNVYAELRAKVGTPKLLIGVDVSHGGLQMAEEFGYRGVRADAHDLPFVSGFADIVTINASLHHSDNMEQVLREAARIVKPGGFLITDHDLQVTMWGDNLMAKLIWQGRLPVYWLLRRGGHATKEEQYWSQATEAHHQPGDGVSSQFFHSILEPLGFAVNVYPHNRTAGAEVLQGNPGRAAWNIRLAQRLTGVNPDSPAGALVMMCVAQRRPA